MLKEAYERARAAMARGRLTVAAGRARPTETWARGSRAVDRAKKKLRGMRRA